MEPLTVVRQLVWLWRHTKMKKKCSSSPVFGFATQLNASRLNSASGFTLVELMVALALGLIVVAAALLLFLTGQKSLAIQQGVAELQDNANFGLNYITQDIRLSNLNTKGAAINAQTLYGGIVFTSGDSAFVTSTTDTTGSAIKHPNLPVSIVGLNATLLTQNNGISTAAAASSNGWTGISNVIDSTNTAVKSDQLVIQYVPQYTLDAKGTGADTDDVYIGGTDCEGTKLEFAKSAGLQVVVQRYFLREDSNRATSESSPLALACDAGYYARSGSPTAITSYGDAGEIIMKRVDHFRVLLGTKNGNKYRYLSIADYMAVTPPRPRILSVQLGALVRSTQSVGADAAVKVDQEFKVLDQTVKAKEMTDPKYIRQVVSQTVALRNALGEREK